MLMQKQKNREKEIGRMPNQPSPISWSFKQTKIDKKQSQFSHGIISQPSIIGKYIQFALGIY